MKAYICDRCQHSEVDDNVGLVPHGWFQLFERGPNKFLTFCSLHCLAQWLQQRVLATTSDATVRNGEPVGATRD